MVDLELLLHLYLILPENLDPAFDCFDVLVAVVPVLISPPVVRAGFNSVSPPVIDSFLQNLRAYVGRQVRLFL